MSSHQRLNFWSWYFHTGYVKCLNEDLLGIRFYFFIHTFWLRDFWMPLSKVTFAEFVNLHVKVRWQTRILYPIYSADICVKQCICRREGKLGNKREKWSTRAGGCRSCLEHLLGNLEQKARGLSGSLYPHVKGRQAQSFIRDSQTIMYKANDTEVVLMTQDGLYIIGHERWWPQVMNLS